MHPPPTPSPHTHPIKKSPGHLDDEGNDPVARPLAEVHADREGDDRPEEVVPLMILRHLTELPEEHALENQSDKLGPEPTTEAEAGKHLVAEDAAETAGEDVHCPEHAGQERRRPRGHLEVDLLSSAFRAD